MVKIYGGLPSKTIRSHTFLLVSVCVFVVGSIFCASIYAQKDRSKVAAMPEPKSVSRPTVAQSTPASAPAVVPEQNKPIDVPSGTTPAPVATTQPKPAAIASKPPTSAPQRATGPATVPFSMSAPVLDSSFSGCTEAGPVLRIGSASATPGYPTGGGTVTWRLEITGAAYGDMLLPVQSDTVYPGRVTYYFSTPAAGLIYEDLFAIPGQAVRLHMLTPNDLATPWLIAPACL